jgi:transposase
MRYELSDFEWNATKPMLPNKMRGVRRVNDRRVLAFRCTVARPAGELWAIHDLLASCAGEELASGTR